MVDIYERAGKAATATADIAVKGAGTVVGAIGASLLGGVLERGVLGQVTPTSTNMKKLGGYALNNGIKAIGSYVAHEYNPKKGMGAAGDFIDGVSYGAAADIGFDTLGRARNKWAPGVTTLASVSGIEKQPDYNAITEKMHQLLMENTALKQQAAMGARPDVGARSAMGAGIRQMITPPHRPLERGYQFTQPEGGYPGSSGLERQYEFTEAPVPGVVKEKRSAEKQFQFTTPNGKVVTGSVTDDNVLKSGFGFIV